jgi:hypothetical protein
MRLLSFHRMVRQSGMIPVLINCNGSIGQAALNLTNLTTPVTDIEPLVVHVVLIELVQDILSVVLHQLLVSFSPCQLSCTEVRGRQIHHHTHCAYNRVYFICSSYHRYSSETNLISSSHITNDK